MTFMESGQTFLFERIIQLFYNFSHISEAEL